ncbi:MAG: WYL domain-containing protein [Bacteroidales bacterium]|nr:WYL domain-containing protein [Bacteroidales bacterium]
MKSYALFKEYIWLVSTICRAGRISLEELNRKWVGADMSEGLPMARSTFNRHKDAIQDIFGIDIECDRRCGFRYYIGNPEVLQEETIQNWMLSTLSVNSVLAESKAVADRILLEPVPSDGENLHKFIDAMKSNVRIDVVYHKYAAEEDSKMTVEPYCVKLFKRRWYALVKSIKHGHYTTLAFDRIKTISLSTDKFTLDADFDAAAWFKECYGIVRDDEKELQTIRIRAFGQEVFYMRDLPLHPTQKEVETADEWSDFEIQIRPTADFFSPLLSRGPLIQVMEPQWLADEIKRQHLGAAGRYE